MENIKEIFDKAIIGFKINHPSEDITEEISEIIIDDLESTINGKAKNNDIIYYLCENDNFFKSSLKKMHKDLYDKKSLSKIILKIVYEDYIKRLDDIEKFRFSRNYAIFKGNTNTNIIGHIDIEDIPQITCIKGQAINFYELYYKGEYKIDGINASIDEKGNIKVDSKDAEYGFIKTSVNIVRIKNPRLLIYDLLPIIIEILDNNFENIKLFESIDRNLSLKTISELLKKYINNIDVTEILKNNGLKVAKNTYKILTNATPIKLLDSFNEIALGGKIEVSTDKGYENDKEKIQQDAVLSIIKNENYFLNMVADGAGASNHGEEASKLLTEQIKDWFENLPDEIMPDTYLVSELLKYKITQIDSLINQKYPNSYTTMVLAITINDKTIIANIGDSTAYTYDYNEEKLIELSTLDSDSKGMEYEESRYNPWNNVLTAAIGSGYNDHLHINIIDNNGQKIILSSDGITDLISEKRFKTYFKENTHSAQMIRDSLSKEDTEYLAKKEDNISAIIINLPNHNKNKIITKKL